MLTHLPKELIVLIITYLPLIDAVRLCSLWREWVDLWTHTRIIELDESYFTDLERMRQLVGVNRNAWAAHIKQVGRRRFAEYVNRTLPRLVAPLLSKFSLRVYYQPKYHYSIEEWIKFAIARNVQELDLDFSDGEQGFSLSEFLRPFNFQSFTTLTSLSIMRMETSMGEIRNLLTNCPLLRVLSLVECSKLIKLKICSPGLRLERLLVKDCGPLPLGVKLCAPRLQYFEYSGCLVRFDTKNLENLVEVVLDYGLETYFHYQSTEVRNLLWSFNKVKVLTLCSYVLKVFPSDYYLFYDPPLQFVNLEHLTLKTCLEGYELPGILYLLGSLPNLKTLSILTGFIRSVNEYMYSEFLPMPDEFLVGARLPFAHLKMAKVEGFTGKKYEMDLLKFLLRNTKFLQTLIIVPRQDLDIRSTRGASSIHLLAIEGLRYVERAFERVQIVYRSMS